ncbi:low molecular weight protein-tyrosine-phosphatase [Corallincola platygyrae]|uniref:Low molecular weight protein-tyrosine-phosphatase n=1 Tax=Corallincola platygyrae TaxID=1193278 RepID=A0ABW4XNQ7_9GAMM
MALEVNSILFVCMGNICRSPSAEAVFKAKAQALGIEVTSDSAGTIGYHQGTPPDPRASAAATLRGYSCEGFVARKVEAEDFEKFDLILAMDQQNLDDLIGRCPEQYQDKVQLMLSYGSSNIVEVPDPYYGGAKGFEVVLDLLEEACDGLLRQLQS